MVDHNAVDQRNTSARLNPGVRAQLLHSVPGVPSPGTHTQRDLKRCSVVSFGSEDKHVESTFRSAPLDKHCAASTTSQIGH